MRFRRIEVRSYRAIDEAELDFGPGLNVLHGPNDLGKSTLASAIRAALLLPAESTAHQAFVPWHDASSPSVRLTFERGGTIYRVSKVFGSGSGASARLESSPDGSSFHEEERGRAVDRRLRELLRWGIELPGGKGQSRGLPESFLSHVLLGNQSDVSLVLERSLADDRDGSGRERLHDALQALAQDPLFKRVLDAAQAKVDAAFTPTGRRKTGQNSPFAQIKDQIAQLAQELDRLSQQRRESEDVAQRIALLGERRAASEAEVSELEARLAGEAELLERLSARQRALERLAAAEAAVHAVDALEAEVVALESELGTARAASEALTEKVALAAEARSASEERAAAAERAELELTSEGALERQAHQRAALEAACQASRGQRAAVAALLDLHGTTEAAEASVQAEAAALAAAERGEAAARQALAAVDAELAELTALEGVLAWREAELGAERARAAAAEAQALKEEAAALRERAAASALWSGPSPVSQPRLDAFRELERELAIAAARLDVGLDVVLKLPGEGRVELEVDGSRTSVEPGAGGLIRQRARSRLRATLAGGIEIEATAGDLALREALEQLERRWRSEVAPALDAAGVPSVAALAERAERARAQAHEAHEAEREAERIEARAADKRESALELEALERRANQRRSALGEGQAEAWLSRLASLRPEAGCAAAGATAARAPGSSNVVPTLSAVELRALEASTVTRRAAATRERERRGQQLAAEAAARVRALTRVSGLAATRDALVAQRAAAWVALGETGAAPQAATLRARLDELERSSAAAVGALEAWQREQASAAAAARREREDAARARAATRAGYEAAQAASSAGRERLVALEAQLRERRANAASSDQAAARSALTLARAALEAHAELPGLTPERHALTRAELARARGELEQTLADLRRAEGALGHVGGDVVVVRERSTQEALERARSLELDRERDYDASRLLLETLRAVENEQGAHLGRALEAPISERFARLTEGRYRQVGLDAGLALQGVAVAGRQRSFRELSEGTQEQLATILRLCIAEYLETALVLDDHLAQTHRARARWFRETLRDAAGRIQIVVLTARPEDYVAEPELAGREASALVRVVDLERIIRRARYAPPPGSS